MQDGSGYLTAVGKQMARLPVEPPLSAILIAGGELHCANEAADVVALMSTDKVFIAPVNKYVALNLDGPCDAALSCSVSTRHNSVSTFH